jgi:hypothetical protein
VDRKIAYSHWGYVDDFRTAFEAIDSEEQLLSSNPPAALLDADLFIFTLRSWEDVADIPARYADLAAVLERVVVPSSAASQIFDLTVDDNGVRRHVRVYFVSLSGLGPTYSAENCFIPFIHANSIFKGDQLQLMKMGCEEGN